jgi:hypothetical protein
MPWFTREICKDPRYHRTGVYVWILLCQFCAFLLNACKELLCRGIQEHPIQNVDRSIQCNQFWNLHVSQLQDMNVYNWAVDKGLCLSTSQTRIPFGWDCKNWGPVSQRVWHERFNPNLRPRATHIGPNPAAQSQQLCSLHISKRFSSGT